MQSLTQACIVNVSIKPPHHRFICSKDMQYLVGILRQNDAVGFTLHAVCYLTCHLKPIYIYSIRGNTYKFRERRTSHQTMEFTDPVEGPRMLLMISILEAHEAT